MVRAPLWMVGVLVLSGCTGVSDGGDECGTASNCVAPPTPLYTADCSIANWIEPCLALASPNDSPSKTEIDLAVNPKDPLNVIVGSKDNDKAASGCVWAVPQVTKDGGKTWTSVYIGGKKSERRPGEPLYGWGCITDPILAFDASGWAYYALQAYNAGTDTNAPPDVCGPLSGEVTSGSTFFLARSKDGGSTWDKIIPLHTGDGTHVLHDYPRMATNPKTGGVFVVWNEFDRAGLPCDTGPTGAVGAGLVRQVMAGTRDRGETPIRPVYLVPPEHPLHGRFDINGFAIDADGKMFVTMDASSGGVNSVHLVTSNDDGNTWTPPTQIFQYKTLTPSNTGRHTPTTKFRIGSAVELAVDTGNGARRGCLYGAWIDNESGHADVHAASSCDGGRTWTPPVRVNQDDTHGYQVMTRIAVTQDGVVHLVYITQAYDPGLRLFDAEHAFSEDGGATWTTQRLTGRSFDGDLGIHQDGGPFFGDYNGIGASGTSVYVGFPHSGSGRAEIAVARIVKTGV